MLSKKLGNKAIYFQFYNMHLYRLQREVTRRKHNTVLIALVSEQ